LGSYKHFLAQIRVVELLAELSGTEGKPPSRESTAGKTMKIRWGRSTEVSNMIKPWLR
jgi:hypothetical protein